MAFETLTYSKSWENPKDFPTYEPDETRVRSDLQLLHNEARDAINRLVAALSDETAASQLPIKPIEDLTAGTVQQAIEQVYAAVQSAASAMIVDGSVTKEKLSRELLQRIYGGKLWVSMEAPTALDDPDRDFPVGQLWLCPGVHVQNLAREDWDVVGGSAAPEGDGWCFTTDGTQDYLTASQLLEGVGEAGQQVMVNLSFGDCTGKMQELGLFIGGVEQELEDGGCFEAQLDQTGSLELQLRGLWAEVSEGDTILLSRLSVVNTDALVPSGCAPVSDWTAFVEDLGVFEQVELPMALYVQTLPGQWEQIAAPVLPVSKGGTGLAGVEHGGLLYGSGEEKLATLPPSDGLLQWAEGKPRWITQAALAEQGSYVRAASGSYVGNESTEPVVHALPAAPILLILSPQASNEDTVILTQGVSKSGQYTGWANKESYIYESVVSLQGQELKLSQEYEGVPLPCRYMNTDGVTYSWTAIY